MAQIISAATLKDMAQIVDSIKGTVQSDTEASLVPLGTSNVSPIEADWVQKYSLKRGTSAFNVTYGATIDASTIDMEHLVSSFNAVLARHQIFRSRYHASNKHPHGVARTYSRYSPQVVRLDAAAFDLWREVNRPFHLDRQNPIRVFVTEKMLLASMSHIIADLTTLQVVLREVGLLYNEEALPRIKHRYANTTQWASPISPEQENWWRAYLKDSEKSANLVSRLPKRSAYDGVTRLTRLAKPLAQRVLAFSAENKVTLHQLALGAVALALQSDTEGTDIVLGGPYFNRGADDVDTVGLFLEPIPIRITHAQNTKTSFLNSVQTASQAAIAHAIPWTSILGAVGATDAVLPNQPLTDVMVTFHDDRGSGKLAIGGLEPVVTFTKGAKFTLLVEFCAVSEDGVVLRLEYDNTVLGEREIRRICKLIEGALEGVVDGKSYEGIKEGLKGVEVGAEEGGMESWFGKRFAELKE